MGERQAPPPGWYVQHGTTETRWWDGEGWTDHLRVDAVPTPSPPRAPTVAPSSSGYGYQSASSTRTQPARYEPVRPRTTFANAVYDYYSRYGIFTGRSSRAEYWYVFLYNALVQLALYLVDIALILASDSTFAVGVLSLLWGLAHFIPGLALFIRRIRDAGLLWWMVFLALIAFVGLIFALLPSTPEKVKATA